jgi:Spy/CpxP family protein refolding chaperone
MGEKRPDLFRELGVTPEQREQIRTLRRQGREDFSVAQKRLREANKALDAAIYSDVLDEQLIERLILQRNEAEAAMSRLKTISELNLRKILTPEQVVKFREIRSRFAKREAEMRGKRRRGPDADRNKTPPPPPDDKNPEPGDY